MSKNPRIIHFQLRFLPLCPLIFLRNWSGWISRLSCQHWFRLWLGANGQQAITWANVDQGLCRHTASLDPNELINQGRNQGTNLSEISINGFKFFIETNAPDFLWATISWLRKTYTLSLSVVKNFKFQVSLGSIQKWSTFHRQWFFNVISTYCYFNLMIQISLIHVAGGPVNSLRPSDAIWRHRSWVSIGPGFVAWRYQAIIWTNVDLRTMASNPY